MGEEKEEEGRGNNEIEKEIEELAGKHVFGSKDHYKAFVYLYQCHHYSGGKRVPQRVAMRTL